MWRNEEVLRFLEWLRMHNAGLQRKREVAFRGLDIYSLNASMDAVIAYLDRVDPPAAVNARRRYGCLSPWHQDPADYGRAVVCGREDRTKLRSLRS
jgi:erythromycin esterase-like protein